MGNRDYTTGYITEELCFECVQGQETFLFSKASRPALGPLILSTKCIPRALSPGPKRRQCEADHTPPPNTKVKNEWSFTSTPHMLYWHVQGELYFIIIFTTDKNSPPSKAEVKNEWSFKSAPPIRINGVKRHNSTSISSAQHSVCRRMLGWRTNSESQEFGRKRGCPNLRYWRGGRKNEK